MNTDRNRGESTIRGRESEITKVFTQFCPPYCHHNTKGSRGDHLLIGVKSRNHHKVSEISQGLYGCNNINDSDHWDSMEANGM